MIPRLLHQMWKTSEVPERFLNSSESWQRLHPTWTYRLWTDDSIDAFVHEHFPEQLSLFRSYPDQIQRVDAARYMILHHFGGVYSDLDIECLRSVESLRQHAVVLPKTAPVGYSNDLMMSEPGHPLFRQLVDELRTSQARWGRWFVPRHFRIMLTTGPLHLTNTVRAFGERMSAQDATNRAPNDRARSGDGAVHVLPPELYSSQDRGKSYVYHWPGNTWAKWDTHALVFVHKHWKLITGGAIAAVAALWYVLLHPFA